MTSHKIWIHDTKFIVCVQCMQYESDKRQSKVKIRVTFQYVFKTLECNPNFTLIDTVYIILKYENERNLKCYLNCNLD